MNLYVNFQGYDFGLIVIADGDYYEPQLLEVQRTKDRALFKAENFRRGKEEKHGNLNLELNKRLGGISWKCSVEGFESIHGIRASIKFIPNGKVILPIPAGVEVKLEDEDSFTAPLDFARFVVFECGDKTLWVHAMESPFKPARIWVSRFGDKMILDVLSEELARNRSVSYESPLWVLEEVSGWREAVDKYRIWMERTYDLKPYEKREDIPEWAKKIALYVNVYAHSYTNRIHYTFNEIEEILVELAERFNPENTLIYLAGWDGRIDMTYPDYRPSDEVGGNEGLRRLVDKAHELGFKIMLHFNMWGVDYKSPFYGKFKEHQVRDSEGRPLGWSADHNKDGIREELFAYISPDYDEFRRLLLKKISSIIEEFKIDAIHLDQSAAYVNDPKHDVTGGLIKLIKEIKEHFPHLLIEGEGINELTVGVIPIYHVIQSYHGWPRSMKPHPVFKELFNLYSKPVGHMDMDSIAYPKRYRKCQELYDLLDVIPSLGLNAQYPEAVGAGLGEPPPMPSLDSAEALLTFEKARKYLERITCT